MGLFDRKKRQKPVWHDGIRFQNEKVRDRYIYLKTLERGGEIINLAYNVRFTVVPAIKDVKSVTYKDGRTRNIKYNVQNPSYFYVDFTYTLKNGEKVAEEVKSDPAKLSKYYLLKKKLMRVYNDIIVKEVYDPYDFDYANYGKKPR